MRHFLVVSLTALTLLSVVDQAGAQNIAGSGIAIEWEVKNRFRLFRSEADFQRHVAAHRNDGVLGAEGRLARESDGRGWARDTVERLCVDRAGKLIESCDRDGERESYLSPRDHRIGVVLSGSVPANVSCAWTFDDSDDAPQQITVPCDEEVRLRIAYGRPTTAAVDIVLPDGTAHRLVTEITVRDVLIAGMGDSIAAGEGNPDRPVRLSEGGFCFRRFLSAGSNEYYRPGRSGFTGNKSCAGEPSEDARAASDWARQSARWESGSCHRSLYSYQLRTALTLAIESPHLAVTYIPLACSGATIASGFLGNQGIRECPSPGTNAVCPGTVRSQVGQLTDLMASVRRQNAQRTLDLILLTIGANDILFSGLVGNVIIQSGTERALFSRGSHIATVADSQKILDGNLPSDFVKLRAALKPLVGGNLARVVFVSYGNPALAAPDTPCPGGRDGFDVHPAFGADGGRLREVTDFVAREFLPKIRALALCDGANLCRDPRTERMTFADSHQAAFSQHGVCVRSNDDPEFDRRCFSLEGKSFDTNPATAATDPMACALGASEYRPYASRARWVRTANDSYFTAMSYPQGMSAMPSNIHDATWGILSAVYGGAIHPTAEGHAAMADGALPAVRAVLGVQAPTGAVISEPLPPPANIRSPQTPLPPR